MLLRITVGITFCVDAFVCLHDIDILCPFPSWEERRGRSALFPNAFPAIITVAGWLKLFFQEKPKSPYP